ADLDHALQPIERALRDHATIIVLDNCESVLPLGEDRESELPLPPGEGWGEGEPLAAILALCQRLLEADARTRLIFTSREWLPAPFRHGARQWEIGALAREDAIELVGQVMKDNGWTPPPADAGNDPEQVVALVEAVHCHARALVLLAREVARRGVRSATADLRALMAELERQHPGDRENSLYASVELSLRRLSPAMREQVKTLAVCQGGVYLAILGMLTGLEENAVRQLAIELIEVGLGEDMGYGHLRFDPGLPPYLLGQLTAGETADLRSRWAEAMAELTGFLHEQRFQDTKLAAQLTLLELPNLLAMLDWLQDRWSPELVVDLAERVERLVAELGRPHALAMATRVRQEMAGKLGVWSHAGFVAEAANIDRFVELRNLPAAQDAAKRLLQRCLAAGETAYPGAAYHIADAYSMLGHVLARMGAAEAALELIVEAQRRFQALADAGDANSDHMVAVSIAETGNCLLDLGRLDEAAEAFKEGIKRHKTRNRLKDMAVDQFQLGAVRMWQRRYAEAMEIYEEARATFAALGEARTVASGWHQIGMVHEEAGQFEPAEQAYRQSLAIRVRENDLAAQASSLNQLGNLSNKLGRLEEAVTFYRQCAEILRLQDLAKAGVAYSNLTDTLIKLRRYDEARQELRRAIECKQPYGHAAQPWKTWSILADLELATGDDAAALAARQQAMQTYLAYRRAGGVSQGPLAELFELVMQAIGQHQRGEAGQQLAQLTAEPGMPDFVKLLVAKLQAILGGERNPALAADPNLRFNDAVELQLLLESLGE
ncbi:MAG: tetratricopeptide repeat protein, partial [Armatimonadota bacterium]|nr:tetratricopeptide repeat protein [Armatimonadota bacterium]